MMERLDVFPMHIYLLDCQNVWYDTRHEIELQGQALKLRCLHVS